MKSIPCSLDNNMVQIYHCPMQKIKPLVRPPKKQNFGLHIYCCGECNTLVHADSTCPVTGKPYTECDPSKQSYKVIAYEKNSSRRRTKNLSTRDLKEALLEAALFQREVKKGTGIERKFQVPVIEKHEGSPLLVDVMAKHIAFLNGENVPLHKKHIRQKKHIDQVDSVYKDFLEVLKTSRYPVAQLTAGDIGDTEVGMYHGELKSKKVSGRTYDLKMGMLKTLYNFLRKENPAEKNPFSGLVKQARYGEVTIIIKEEFELFEKKLMENTWANGELDSCSEKRFYKDLLLKAVRTGIYSGRRLEELCMACYKDISQDGDGQMLYLTVTDFKVSRRQNREDDPKKIKVPVNRQLNEVLSADFEKYKGTDKFILDPEERLDRKTLKSFISHSFKRYWKKLGINKNVSFKTLRATHISHLADFLGLDRSRMITGHSGNDVLTKHYISQEVIAHSAKNFTMFSNNKSSREEELEQLRKSNGVSLEK